MCLSRKRRENGQNERAAADHRHCTRLILRRRFLRRFLKTCRPLDFITREPDHPMFMEFDQTTLAYMTAALEQVCRKIPSDKDSNELRKRIADAMIASARDYRRTTEDFLEAGTKVLAELEPKRSFWPFRRG
jgi:hypothetical protein